MDKGSGDWNCQHLMHSPASMDGYEFHVFISRITPPTSLDFDTRRLKSFLVWEWLELSRWCGLLRLRNENYNQSVTRLSVTKDPCWRKIQHYHRNCIQFYFPFSCRSYVYYNGWNVWTTFVFSRRFTCSLLI
jgi:hypothetical protein